MAPAPPQTWQRSSFPDAPQAGCSFVWSFGIGFGWSWHIFVDVGPLIETLEPMIVSHLSPTNLAFQPNESCSRQGQRKELTTQTLQSYEPLQTDHATVRKLKDEQSGFYSVEVLSFRLHSQR